MILIYESAYLSFVLFIGLLFQAFLSLVFINTAYKRGPFFAPVGTKFFSWPEMSIKGT